MRIAQVSPLYESVPPTGYGGTERVVSYLTEELVALGHDVTLFASGDSVTKARLVVCCDRALRLSKISDPLSYHTVMLERVIRQAEDFDIVHFHTDYLHFSLARRADVPVITTLHGRLDLQDLIPVYKEFADIPLVSISNAQRRPLHWANWTDTVYHGLPSDLYSLNEDGGDYLVFIGRISPEKKVSDAIEIARLSGMPLKIAAKVDKVDEDYFRDVIRPMFKDPLVEFVGEVGEKEKQELLCNAAAFVFPIDWPEPFGLAMIESMACGTPVLARRRGSVPEIIEDGKTGFIFDTVQQAVSLLEPVRSLGRSEVRNTFVRRFLAGEMTRNYLSVYQKVISQFRSPQLRRIA